MSDAEARESSPGLQFSIGDLLFALLAASISSFCAVQSSWDVGVLVGTTLILSWHTRNRRYSTAPGAALGVLLAWLSLRVGVDAPELLSLTSAAAATGAALNSIICRYYVAGSLALLVVITVAFLIPILVA